MNPQLASLREFLHRSIGQKSRRLKEVIARKARYHQYVIRFRKDHDERR